MSTFPNPPLIVGPAPADGQVATYDAASNTWKAGSGGSGSPTVSAVPFAFDTPGILTGAALFTPTEGDILLDVWIQIDEAWDGTTPLCDIGTFSGVNYGWWYWMTPYSQVQMDYGSDDESVGLLQGRNGSSQSSTLLSASADVYFTNSTIYRSIPAKFLTDDPVKVVVSQDGTTEGADPGSTQGSAVLYLVTVTPKS